MPELFVHDLRCESLQQPIGLHTRSPRLSWKLLSSGFDVVQVSYRVEVFASLEQMARGQADVWDSGEVQSGHSHGVVCSGLTLDSGARVFWRVTVRDNFGHEATSTEEAFWEMGLVEPCDWSAAWIRGADRRPSPDVLVNAWCEAVVYQPTTEAGYEREQKLDDAAVANRGERIEAVKRALPATWLRKSFTVSKPVARARLYAASLGYAELHLDGTKLNDRVLDPAQTDYEVRALYTVDVLDGLLAQGEHELSIHLAEGWYGQSHGFFNPDFRYGDPVSKAQLEVEYLDGTRESIGTDSTWQAAPSELAKTNLYSGEVCDGRVRREELVWGPVVGPAAEQPLPPRLEPQLLPPVRKADAVAAQSISETSPGVFLVDMGVNFAGWVSLNLEAPRGTPIDLKYAESVTPDNRLDWDTMGRRAVGAYQWDRYIAGGQGPETYEPRFTYHGFRYVEISGLAAKPRLEDIVGHQVRTDFARTGSFRCSDPFLNKLHRCILWTYESNFVGLPADCPHREKCGWLDAYNTAEMVYHNWDIGPSIGKYIEDIRSSSDLLGGLPGNIAPGRRNGLFEAFDWGICTVLLPWHLFAHTGDLRVAEEHWEHMVGFLAYGEERYPGGIASGSLGDWCDQPATLELSFTRVDGSPFNSHPATTASMHWFFATAAMATMARALGKPEAVAEDFQRRAERIRKAINEAYFHERAMTFASQAENALALVYGVVDPENRQAVADRLAEEVVHANAGHFNVGAHGAGFLYHALSNFGHADVASEMFRKEAYPSYRYMFAQGATSIWENMSRWDPVNKTTSKSLSHPFQSSFHHWFFNAIGGVQRDPAAAGFKKLIFAPQTVGDHSSAEACIQTPWGPAKSSWELSGSAFRWTVEVPPNASATVVVPDCVQGVVLQGEAVDVQPREVLGRVRPQTVLLGSGRWEFGGHRPEGPVPSSVVHRL